MLEIFAVTMQADLKQDDLDVVHRVGGLKEAKTGEDPPPP